jgi:hypothetical protein
MCDHLTCPQDISMLLAAWQQAQFMLLSIRFWFRRTFR